MSDQDLHCLFTQYSILFGIKSEKYHRTASKFEMDLPNCNSGLESPFVLNGLIQV